MTRTFEAIKGDYCWRFRVTDTDDAYANRWTTVTESCNGTAPGTFTDESEALLMNTVERWAIINGMVIRPCLYLTKGPGAYDYYHLNDERVFISFRWAITAKYRYRKTKRVRVQSFFTMAEDRDGATRNARYHFKKSAEFIEMISLSPVEFGHCYWKQRPGYPNIDSETLSRIPLPENL